MYCSRCGRRVSDILKRCPDCGGMLAETRPILDERMPTQTQPSKEREPSKAKEISPPPVKLSIPQEKPKKKPFFKRGGVWFATVLVIAVVGGVVAVSKGFDLRGTSRVRTGINRVEHTASPTPTPTEITNAYISLNAQLAELDALLYQNYRQNYRLETDGNVVTVDIWANSIVETALFAASGDAERQNEWGELIATLLEAQTFYEDMLNQSRNNPEKISVALNVIDNENSDNVLLSIASGRVLYDATSEGDLSSVAQGYDLPEPTPTAEPTPPGVQNVNLILDHDPEKMWAHRPGCEEIADIAWANRLNFNGTIEDAQAMGYGSCVRCNPW